MTQRRFRECVNQFVETELFWIAFDLSALEFCDSVGIAAFISAWRRAHCVRGAGGADVVGDRSARVSAPAVGIRGRRNSWFQLADPTSPIAICSFGMPAGVGNEAALCYGPGVIGRQAHVVWPIRTERR